MDVDYIARGHFGAHQEYPALGCRWVNSPRTINYQSTLVENRDHMPLPAKALLLTFVAGQK
jgi:hypothetical protein